MARNLMLWAAALCLMLLVITGGRGDPSSGSQQQQQSVVDLDDGIIQDLDPATHFRGAPKNILFAVTAGGSSHHSWVMRVLDELNRRGHRITYATTDENLRFSRQRPHIKTVAIGPPQIADPRLTRLSADKFISPMRFDTLTTMFEVVRDHYPQNYITLVETIDSESIDIVICDHMSFACHDAAWNTKHPHIITMMANEAPDAAQPYINTNFLAAEDATTEHMSYSRRFYASFVWPIKALWHMAPEAWWYRQMLQRFNTPLLESRWTDSLKLVNNLHAFDPARPMGPLVELVGPIYNDHFDALPTELATFLDGRKKVVYVAFGQHAQTSSAKESTRILEMLLRNYEDGVLDGFIWSATKGTPLPQVVGLSSGSQYQLDSEEFKAIGRIVSWAPQTALLRHPAVVTFVTHGGLMSLFEAFYQGKRILVCPFMMDQFPNSMVLEHAGAALWISLEERSNSSTMADKLQRTVEDKDGSFQRAIDRYQALFQIHGRSAVDRAANLVEEVLFTADSNGHMLHRRDIARNLSFLKRNNYDLYLGLLALLATMGLSVRYVVRFLSKPNGKIKMQ